MDRTKFYTIETVDGVPELDYLHNNLTKFNTSYQVGYYVVREEDLVRPDMISYKLYGTVKYWWLLMMYNGILNIWGDLEVGLTLKVPNILDIWSFYKKNSVRT